jgi:ABC-type Co2+ transport system permease subunit
MLLFAVHISDGVLLPGWLALGWLGAACLIAVAAWKIGDEEIPYIALLTAAFFIASSIHLRVGPSSVHLLLSGVIGMVLGRRASLAIAIGLGLQYFLLVHGGLYSLGVNTCIMAVPALAAGLAFRLLRGSAWMRQPLARSVWVLVSTLVWLLSAVYGVAVALTNRGRTMQTLDFSEANAIAFHPAMLFSILCASVLATWLERAAKAGPDFALGLVIGELTVLATIALNAVVLLLGGEADFSVAIVVLAVLHLPLAAVEGIVAGFLVSFLERVQPALLGRLPWHEAARQNAAASVPASNSGDGADGQAGPGPSALCAVQLAPGRKSDDQGLLRGR